MIDNNGGNGKNDGAGGGSGGSILIKTLMFSGHGSIQVNGGDGRGSGGGGGSGGRLAVHVSWLREYSGMKAFTLRLLNGIYINYIPASCLCFQTNYSLINLQRLE